jgi:hypothetical protein
MCLAVLPIAQQKDLMKNDGRLSTGTPALHGRSFLRFAWKAAQTELLCASHHNRKDVAGL